MKHYTPEDVKEYIFKRLGGNRPSVVCYEHIADLINAAVDEAVEAEREHTNALIAALEFPSEVYKCRKHGGHGFQSDCVVCKRIEAIRARSGNGEASNGHKE